VAAALGGTTVPAPASSYTVDERAAIEPLDAAMKAHIGRALRATQGRVEGPTGAAHLLRINPHTLRARMRKLGVDLSKYRVAVT